ncbi:MAG: orotidine-5'-phosphate decarboxylase [bacterium]|nr:orotidine-5'-phosphate decarboxylase [bacterium]
MKPEIIVALDLIDEDKILRLIKLLGNKVSYYKIGYIAFYRFGWNMVDRLKDLGKKIMLDLKLDDIPNTVSYAIEAILPHKPTFVTIHSSVGKEALLKAKEATRGEIELLGITLLTSLGEDDLEALNIYGDIRGIVLKRAKLCKESGLKGVVASVNEAEIIKREIGEDFLVVTPGIRISLDKDDQKRIGTYKDAREKGVDFVVIGRPIYESDDPLGVIESLEKE